MNWEWKENSILNPYNEHTPCKEIFHATCDEIAEYFIPKGWKYAKSRPKLTYKTKSIKLEIAFWSSGSNTAGEWVNLEIIPSFTSLDLKNHLKAQGIKTNAYLELINFSKLTDNIPSNLERVVNILTPNIEREQRYQEEKGILIHNNNVNIYGIDTDDFVRIIDFIESQITPWIDWCNDFSKLEELSINALSYYKKRMSTGDFIKYIELKFPDKVNLILKVLGEKQSC